MNIINIIYPFIYAGILVYWFVAYRHKVGYFGVGAYTLIMLVISACCGAIYELNPIFSHLRPFSLVAYLYLIVIHYFYYKPILNVRERNIQKIWSPPVSTVKGLIVFLALINFLPLIENSIHIVGNLASGSVFNAGQFMDRTEDDVSELFYMTTLGRRFQILSAMLSTLTILLSFYYFCLPKKFIKKRIIACIVLCIANTVTAPLAIGQRGPLLMDVFFMGFCYFFFKTIYIESVRKRARKILLTGGIVFSLALISISVGRYISFSQGYEGGDNLERTGMQWVLQYIGESHGNFSSDMWGETHLGNYDPVLKAALGVFKINLENPQPAQRFMGDTSLTVRWTTYVGTYYLAYGPYLTFIILIGVGLIFTYILRERKVYRVSDFILLSLYARAVLTSFEFFPFMLEGAQVITMPVFYLLFRIWERGKGHFIITTINQKI